MVPSPLALFEVDEDFVALDVMQFAQTCSGEGPEAVDAVDVVLPLANSLAW